MLKKDEIEDMLEFEGLYEPFKIKSLEIDGQQMFCLVDKDGIILDLKTIDKLLKFLQPFYKSDKSEQIIHETNTEIYKKLFKGMKIG
jgi:hypothetical protein